MATPPADAQPLRTDRDIVVLVLLSLITCGIYDWWFIYKLAQDANVLCADDDEETPGLLVYLLLSIATCGVYSYYWEYKLANRLQANGPSFGIDIKEGGSEVLLWLILGIVTCGLCNYVAIYILINNMNTLSSAYNERYGF